MTPVIETTSTIWIAKLCWYIWITILFQYLNIIDIQVCILAILMLVDFVFWIWKQFVIDKKEITSHKAWLWAFKKISTLLLFLSVALMFKGIWVNASLYLSWIISIFIMAETYSIIQNIYTIRTGKILPEYDVISEVIKKIWEYIISLIDKKNK